MTAPVPVNKPLPEKVYRHRTPGAKFYMPDGREIAFVGGRVRLSSIDVRWRGEVEKQLDAVANQPQSHIFTTHEVFAPEEKMLRSEMMKEATAQFDADKRITGNPATVPIPVSPQMPPILTPVEDPVGAAQTPQVQTGGDAMAAARAAVAAAVQAKVQK